MSVSPVAFKEVLQLTQLGIQAAQISFKTITVQSDKYVVVNQGRSLAVVDCATKNVLNLPVPVDSAIMNPLSKVVAVRSKASTDTVTKLKIYNLEMKTNMKSSQIAGDVSYWRWLDAKTIAIVGPKSVYHWSMEGNAEPQKIFDRAPAKGQVQVRFCFLFLPLVKKQSIFLSLSLSLLSCDNLLTHIHLFYYYYYYIIDHQLPCLC
jgi:clathrin heavy chain